MMWVMKNVVVLSVILMILAPVFYVGKAHAEYVGICSGERIITQGDNGKIPFGASIHSRVIRGRDITVLCPSRLPATRINNVPVWFQLSTQSVFNGGALQFVVSATDIERDNLTYSVLNLPDGALFDGDSRTFTWIPNNNQYGVYKIIFRVADKFNFSDMAVEIDVYPYAFSAYKIPTRLNFFNINPPLKVNEKELYITTLQVSGGNDLYYRVINGPRGLKIDNKFGVVYWVPDINQGRQEPYLVSIGVTNGKVEVSKSFYITVYEKI